ncbi:hypothetical protein AB1Y20_009396 [Prymnesium parvum]|uniref:Site-specific DNA-methyltransferase (adenine-specific) n=1 Tax=Prymnesium parvum TaxID=97485 RepID=A0AB34K4D3_PRYPA
MGKGKKRPRVPEQAAREDPEGEIEGFVEAGELYLRDERGVVYSSERDARGSLVTVGHWDASKAAIIHSAPAAVELPQTGLAPPPSTPHPPPEPLTFEAFEEDHCETAPEAYDHIVGVLHALAHRQGVKAEELRIYDPYYCNGAVQRHLAARGFHHVYNKNEDFYVAQASGALPSFDVLVTNPPYTHPHPQKLLDFCVACKKPWLALMPNWVCTKDFFHTTFSLEQLSGHERGARRGGSAPFFIVPRKRYHYWTPRGRRADVSAGGAKSKTHGHTNAALGVRTSPFVSFWYCGGISPKVKTKLSPPDGCVLAWSQDSLPPGVQER